MDSILVVDPDLVTEAVRSLALNTIGAFQNGITVKWNDAELGVYLVYIFGEINKSEVCFVLNTEKKVDIISLKLVGRVGQRSAKAHQSTGIRKKQSITRHIHSHLMVKWCSPSSSRTSPRIHIAV